MWPTRCCRRLLRNAVVSCRIPDNFHLRRPPAASNGLGLTEDRLRLDRLPATAAASFFPPRVPRFASRSKKAVDGRHALRCGPSGAGRSLPGPRTTIEAAIGAARLEKGDTTMATIGTFTKTENGFTGSVKTLTPQRQAVKFVPDGGRQRRGPDYPHLRRRNGFRCSLEEDRPRDAARISLGQARRSELPGADLRRLVRPRAARATPDLVPPQRRLSPTGSTRPASSEAGLLMFMARHRPGNGDRMADVRILRLAHPDQIAKRPPPSRAQG